MSINLHNNLYISSFRDSIFLRIQNYISSLNIVELAELKVLEEELEMKVGNARQERREDLYPLALGDFPLNFTGLDPSRIANVSAKTKYRDRRFFIFLRENHPFTTSNLNPVRPSYLSSPSPPLPPQESSFYA